MNSKESHDNCCANNIAEGMVFPSWNCFAYRYELHIKATNSPVFVISRSSKFPDSNRQITSPLPLHLHLGYKKVEFVCSHGGHYDSKSTGVRPLQRTAKTGCPAQIKVVYDRKRNVFVIKSYSDVHVGHPVDEHTFKMYSINRGFRGLDFLIPRVHVDAESHVTISKVNTNSNPIKSNVERFIKYDTSSTNIKRYLREERGVEISTQGIINLKEHLQRSGDSETSSSNKFLQDLLCDAQADKGMILETMTTNNDVQLIYFQYAWMTEFFRRYPDHILLDGTYCLNENRMPLYIILAVDGNNNSIPVAFGLLSQETKPVVEQFVSFFVQHNPACDKTKSYMTDKDITEISALKKFFPNAKHELCLFHVLKNFKDMVHASDLPKRMYDDCKTLLQEMAYATNEEAYYSSFDKFRLDFSSYKVVTQFINRWHNCRDAWTQFNRMTTYNLGDTTNNRLESFNSKLKQSIKKYAPLDDFYRSLKSHLNNMLDKLYMTGFKATTHKFNTHTDVPHDILDRVYKCGTYYAYREILCKITEGIGSRSDIESRENEGYFIVDLPKHDKACTTLNSCNCSFYVMNNLPCAHIFALRFHLKKEIFTEDLVPQRWNKSHYINTLNACRSQNSVSHTSLKRTPVETVSFSSETVHFLEGKLVCNTLLEILKSSTDDEFSARLQFLNKLAAQWSGPESKKTNTKTVILDATVEKQPEVPKTGVQLEQWLYTGNGQSLPVVHLPIAIKPNKSRKLTVIGKKRKLPKPSERLPKQKLKITDYFGPKPNKPRDLGQRPKKSTSLGVATMPTASDPMAWLNFDNVKLTNEHYNILRSNAWLDSDIIYAASFLLKKEHNLIEGLQHTTLQIHRPPAFKICYSNFVQICHVSGNHWVCLCGRVEENVLILDLYDSMGSSRVAPDIISVASSLNRSHDTVTDIQVNIHNVDLQPNQSDCGLFAIAFAKLICEGKNPSKVTFEYNNMRQHLLACFVNSKIDEFPASYNRVIPVQPLLMTFKKVYCFCRMPGTPVDMIKCRKCLEFFHKHCIKDKYPHLTQFNNYTCVRCGYEVVVV